MTISVKSSELKMVSATSRLESRQYLRRTRIIKERDKLLARSLRRLPEHPALEDYDALIDELVDEKKEWTGSEAGIREQRMILGSVILRLRRRRSNLHYQLEMEKVRVKTLTMQKSASGELRRGRKYKK